VRQGERMPGGGSGGDDVVAHVAPLESGISL
jgi:hypothetical protein